MLSVGTGTRGVEYELDEIQILFFYFACPRQTGIAFMQKKKKKKSTDYRLTPSRILTCLRCCKL